MMESSQISTCAGCGQPIRSADPWPALWSGGVPYHLACAPSGAIESAAEEYQAILRKGVRYFVDKYGGPSDSAKDIGGRFLTLGRAVEEEQVRRSKSATRPDSGSAAR
jgi:hypothetical protein